MKKAIYAILEKVTIELVIHLLKVSGGFATYLTTKLVEYGFEKVIVPLLNFLVIQGVLYYDTEKGKIRVKKLHTAREGGSDEEYDSAVDDILG